MDERRKQAYRFLLYRALLDIRPMAWFHWRGLRRILPLLSGTEAARICRAGGIADWLHNLALFSVVDFEAFEEQWFWSDHEALCERYPDARFYRGLFDGQLSAPPIKARDIAWGSPSTAATTPDAEA